MPAVRRQRLFLLAAAVAVAAGVAAAAARAWVCDDAFISFRYALNLVRGQGLVFNPGERVEGYSNPLWTILMAVGLALGRDLEHWAVGWGLAACGEGGNGNKLFLAEKSLVGTEAQVSAAAVDAGIKVAITCLGRYGDGHVYTMDGVSVEYPDWHFNVRPSNTEPLLRLNLEAVTASMMEAKRDEVLELIRA